jgi:hypothetical protein
MEMKPATTDGKPSSNVHSVGYDEATKTLAVCYLDKDRESAGPTYHYENVEPHHYAEMMKDDISTGSYVHRNIIKGGYKFQKQ